MKRETSPYDPYKRKAKGKENSRYASQPRLSRARAHVTRLACEVDAALDEAIAAFNGTCDDRCLWAEIAWRVGVENFAHAVIEKKSEDAADGRPRRPAAAFQKFLNERFPKPEVRGQRSNSGGQRYE